MDKNIEIKKAGSDALMDQVLEIRRKVFTEEQGISRQLDNDGKDPMATNVLLSVNNEVAGTGRIVIEGSKGTLARIAVLAPFRGKGYARLIIRELEKHGLNKGVQQFELFPHRYLKEFYESQGYYSEEDKIYHVEGHELIKMIKKDKGKEEIRQ